MKLIVGLGNPGNEYNFTRHNSGFLALDFYAKINNLKWEPHPKFGALYLKDRDCIFIKPQGFYNTSGVPVKAFMSFYKIPPRDVLVVCDDFNLDFGKTRYRAKGTAGGNNGLKSIIAELKTDEFPRLRIGTGNDALRKKLGDVDFVLSKFTPDEKAELPTILSSICSYLKDELGL
ncbi:aminoacyl-tRNA hydrolase [Candidatus Saccharibacteria bacterium]|nr:aminoacyl-tRNA hydrolase [Candidatus Saccharibacteria bacterium]